MSIQKISSTIVYDDNFALKTIKKVENYEIFRKLAWLTAYVALASFVMLNLIAVGTNTCSTMTNTLNICVWLWRIRNCKPVSGNIFQSQTRIRSERIEGMKKLQKKSKLSLF